MHEHLDEDLQFFFDQLEIEAWLNDLSETDKEKRKRKLLAWVLSDDFLTDEKPKNT